MNGLVHILAQKISFASILVLFFMGGHTPVNAQDTNEQSSRSLAALSEYIVELYGTNNIVVNGRSYIPDHYNAKGHPYFSSDKLTKSTLVIDGKKYGNQEVLYNIETEKVILKTTINTSDEVLLVLNTGFIDAFYFDGHYFVNGAKYFPESGFPGFLEQVFEGGFSVVTRHQKSFISRYTANTPNGFYSGTTSVSYIFNKGEVEKLPTKNALFKYFPDHKKEIKKFLRKYKIKYKQANAVQLNKLFTYCDEISSK
ncbi:MAG: hypothetical protein DRJ05_15455 [Bacteroidetes bacterium]|nr:MAG: hypothetical protein DRJ05_15455 [Bacteroidota bacterium]